MKATLLVFVMVGFSASSTLRAAPAVDKRTPSGVEDLLALQKKVLDIRDKIRAATVTVKGPQGGSGVIVSKDGLVLTARIVSGKPGQKRTIILHDGRKFDGIALGNSKRTDSGMIQIKNPKDLPTVEFVGPTQPEVGQWCVAVGNVGSWDAKRGAVFRLGRVISVSRSTIHTDCKLLGGDSGGPLFDLNGKVIGTHSRISRATNQNYHAPIIAFHDNWDDLKAGKTVEPVDEEKRRHPAVKLPSLSSTARTDGRAVMAAFVEANKVANQCKVSIMDGVKVLCVGTLITDDGLIITKYSEIMEARQPLRIAGNDRRLHRGRIIAHDIGIDLALIKSDIRYPSRIEWGTTEGLGVGHLLTAGIDGQPGIHCGIVSAYTREIENTGGVPGIILGGRDGREFGGVEVTQVVKGGPAEEAGMKRGDIIFSINGDDFTERVKMINKVKSFYPGTPITVSVKRGDEMLDIKVTLGYHTLVFADKKSRNDMMSGKVSNRRTGFKRVIQHEISLGPSDMGGPLLDLEGKLIGINIAKANRTEFYAIPVEQVRKFLQQKISASKKFVPNN